MKNETAVVGVEQMGGEQKSELDILETKVLKFLKVFFPQSFFQVKVRDGSFVSKDGSSIGYIVEIKTSLIRTTEGTRRTIFYLEEKFSKEGLTGEEFERLLYLKRLMKKDEVMRQEIKRVLLHNRILGQKNVIDFVIEGFEVGSLLADLSFDEDRNYLVLV